MNHSEFWASIATIIQDGFTPEGLTKLERYAEQFISGQLVYKRFSPHEQYGCAAGGVSNVIASLLAGAEIESDKDAPGESGFKRTGRDKTTFHGSRIQYRESITNISRITSNPPAAV